MNELKEYKKAKQFLIEIKEYQAVGECDKTICDYNIWCWSNMDLQQELHNAKYNIAENYPNANVNDCKVFYTELKTTREYTPQQV